MPHAKRAVALGTAAILVCGCSSAVKPPQGRGHVDDPRIDNPNHVACLRQQKLPVQLVGRNQIQIGPFPGGPTVVYEPTPGAAQGVQIQGASQAAEAIGAALLYPHSASGSELSVIETCLSKGVSG
jgi:hypothetical protein